jgi:hypothetical protein
MEELRAQAKQKSASASRVNSPTKDGGMSEHSSLPYDENDPQNIIAMMKQPVAEHSGDKLNGFDYNGDDEYITVDLMRVDPCVHVIYFMVILYGGIARKLSDVPKCYARLLNKKNSGHSKSSGSYKEVDRLPISQLLDDDSHTVLVPYAVYRKTPTTWALVPVSELMSGRDWVDVFPFLRAFTALGVSCERWADWKRDIAPFAVRITIRRIRDLGPLEPHQFCCRCMVWVQDRNGVGRYKTAACKNRDNIEFDESCTFFVDKLDVIRIMVYETAMVGHVDIPMAEFFPLTPPPLTLSAMCYEPANNREPPPMETANDVSSSPQNHHSAGSKTPAPNGNEIMNTTHNNSGNNNNNSTSTGTNNNTPFYTGRARPVMDGETMLSTWLPLQGIGITGEIEVMLERVALKDAIEEETQIRKKFPTNGQKEGKGWSCIIA